MDDDLPKTRRRLPSLTTVIKEKLLMFKSGTLPGTDCSIVNCAVSSVSLNDPSPISLKSSTILNPQISELKDKYTILTPLSETETILIRKARYSTGQLRVIKSIKLSSFDRKSLKLFKKMLSKCGKLSSPIIARVYEYFVGRLYIHICMEYCSGTSLNEYVLKSETDISQIKSYTRQILSIVNCLEKTGIAISHLNKDSLWFATESSKSPLKFVGFEYLVISGEKTSKKPKSASRWCRNDFRHKISVWELGVILIKWLIRLYNLTASNSRIHSYIIWKALLRKQEDLNKYFSGIQTKMKDFISKALVLDASRRASTSELLQHSWMEYTGNISKPMQDLIVEGLMNAARSSILQLDVLKYISCNLYSYSDIYQAHLIWALLDKKCNGFISFKDILSRIDGKGREKALLEGFNRLNNSKKFLSYSDFVAGLVDWKTGLSASNIDTVFKQIEETEGTGVTRSKLDFCLKSNDAQTRWQQITSIIGRVSSINQQQFYTLVKDS